MNTMKAQIEVDELVHMDEEDEDEGESEVEADMFDDVIENGAEMKSRNVGHSNNPAQATRTSEHTVAFEGEVYFPAVTPEKVQTVLLHLGGRELSTTMPSSEFLEQHPLGKGDFSQWLNPSRKIESLVRFRENRKERCFEKKIRYTCRKEVSQRMNHKNGQLASVKDSCNHDSEVSDPSNGTLPENAATSTPAMRWGPAGPRSLCNACGLMWANKGTLRDLKKGKRVTSFDQNEPETPMDIKPSYMEAENSYHIQDLQGSMGNAKSLQLESENSSMRPDEEDFLETAEASSPDYWPIQVDNSSVNLVDQDKRRVSIIIKLTNFWYLGASFRWFLIYIASWMIMDKILDQSWEKYYLPMVTGADMFKYT